MTENAKLGTFIGVFTPTVLTILGVILYLRVGWVVGHLGLSMTLAAVILANAITIITTLSFSSVATNIHVGQGGAYYIISRSMGLEVGGAVGVPLFLSQAFSVTLYAFGLAESLRLVWPGAPIQEIAFAVVLLVGLLSFKGADFALKIQIPIMAFVGLSILALTIGVFMKGLPQEWSFNEASGEVDFWTGFAVFFPAVTGIMAGLGLSGDLADPKRSIPRGALWATGTGLLVYMIVPFLLVAGADAETLRNDSNVWSRIAPLGSILILPGLWGAIFSSAVGSMLGAPRTLLALSNDLFQSPWINRLLRSKYAMAIGMAFSLAIALGAVALGDLNAVAPVVTMFFLTVYGAVNIVAAVETLSGDPSWRPKFRVPWVVNVLGGLGCAGVMFLINAPVGIGAIVIELVIFLLLVKRQSKARWGDARRGMYEAMIRRGLIQLAKRPFSSRNWRPHLMVFVDEPERRMGLIRFASWLSQGRGVVTVNQLILGDLLSENLDMLGEQERTQKLLHANGLVAFAEINVVKELVSGMSVVAQANGLAGLESNTILLGWPRRQSRLAEMLRFLRRMERLNKSIVIGKVDPSFNQGVPRRRPVIHVWWGGLQKNGDLMLLLAHLLSQNKEWREAVIQVNSLASNELSRKQTLDNLNRMIPNIRIKAEAQVHLIPENGTVSEIIHEQSANADVVFLGLAMPARGQENQYAERLALLIGEMKTVFFVKNSSLFVGKLLTGDEEPTSSTRSKLPGGA